MSTLSYSTLSQSGYKGYLLQDAPERIIQFGEGNFLRAFVDYFIDIANEHCGFNAKVLAVQPVDSPIRALFQKQDCLYTLCLRGMENGERVDHRRVISCISRCISAETQFDAVLEAAGNPELEIIVSNTTEAGIVFCETDLLEEPHRAAFPGKLTRFLLERYRRFDGDRSKGFILLPCELIDDNAVALKDCVQRYIQLWKLDDDFAAWVEEANHFCPTLVDRIVPGYPAAEAEELNQENGYTDSLLDSAEPFGLWVIEGPAELAQRLPFAQAGLPVVITDNHKPYKQRKVRILNGAHTSLACIALQCGVVSVGESMQDELLRGFVDKAIHGEIIPTLDLPQQELLDFAQSVQDRFQNPFIHHELMSIMLNVTSKWRARVLPSVEQHLLRFGKLPTLLTLSFAAYLSFMHNPALRNTLKEDGWVLDFFAAHEEDSAPALAAAACANTQLWGRDLGELDGFVPAVQAELESIAALGMRQVLARRLEEAK